MAFVMPPPLRADGRARTVETSSRAYASLFSAVLMPAWERIVRRRDTLNYLTYLEASQWLAPEERAKRELLELKDLLSYAGEHVPYYRDLFKRQRFEPRGVSSRADL